MKIKGIRNFLLWGIGTTIMLLLVVVGLYSYSSTRHEVDELFDAELAQYARVVNLLLLEASVKPTGESLEIPVPVLPSPDSSAIGPRRTLPFMVGAGHKYERKIAFQVWRADRELLLRSESAPAAKPIAERVDGFGSNRFDGAQWTTFSLFDASLGIWVMTAQRNDVRDELSIYLALGQLLPLAASVVPVLLLIIWVVQRAMSSINALSSALLQLNPAQGGRIELTLPIELRPVQDAVNTLLAAQEEYIAREKRFIADVSHELRTPLSILAVHSRNLLAQEHTSSAGQAAQAIQAGVRRLSRLVGQLMELEKLEHVTSLERVDIELHEVVQNALAQVSPGNIERVHWTLDIPAQVRVRVEPELFGVALRNFLDNAAKYGVAHAEVLVTLDAAGVFSVRNTLPEDCVPDLERLGERFFRHAVHAQIEGSGLGVALSKRILGLHGLEVQYVLIAPGILDVQIDLSSVIVPGSAQPLP